MNESRRARRPSAGGYARGDETRRKIIEAAIGLFGRHGFDGASTREIAARAGVNAPALQYYFENKEGLYLACAESLADDSWRAMEPAVLRGREALAHAAQAGPATDTEALIEAFVGVQAALADHTFVKRSDPDRRLFFAREQGGGEPETGSRLFHQRVRQPLNDVSLQLLERITGLPASDPRTIIRMFSLYGQLVVFYIAHRSALTLLDWSDIDAGRAEFLKANICEQSRVLLRHWSAQREAGQAD